MTARILALILNAVEPTTYPASFNWPLMALQALLTFMIVATTFCPWLEEEEDDEEDEDEEDEAEMAPLEDEELEIEEDDSTGARLEATSSALEEETIGSSFGLEEELFFVEQAPRASKEIAANVRMHFFITVYYRTCRGRENIENRPKRGIFEALRGKSKIKANRVGWLIF